jgi:hypothetical protein
MIIKVKKIVPFFRFAEGEAAANTLPSAHFFPFFRFQDEDGKDVVGSCLFTNKGRFFIQQEESWYEVVR